MAGDNIVADITTNEWYGGKLFEWPPEIYKWKEYVNEVAQWLIAALEIASMALEIIKAYLICFLDPLLALVKAIIAEIRAFLRDLSALGVYITGDFPIYGSGYLGDFGPKPSWNNTMVWPLKELIGGFTAAERRIIGKLSNRADPGRPDVSPRTKVLAIAFYVTADFTGIYSMIRAIRAFIALFKMSAPTDGGLPRLSLGGLAYGNESTGSLSDVSNFFEAQYDAPYGQPPALFSIDWTLNQPAAGEFGITFPTPGPPGFLIEVSTLPGGLPIFLERKSETDSAPKTNSTGQRIMATEIIPVQNAPKDKTQLILYGGADQLAVDDQYAYNRAAMTPDGNLSDGRKR